MRSNGNSDARVYVHTAPELAIRTKSSRYPPISFEGPALARRALTPALSRRERDRFTISWVACARATAIHCNQKRMTLSAWRRL